MTIFRGLKPPQIKVKIAELFKEHRKHLGITQADAAKVLKLERTSVTNIENVKQALSAENYIYFCTLEQSDFAVKKRGLK